MNIVGNKKPQDPSVSNVIEMINRGLDKAHPSSAAVKLMVNHAPTINGFIKGNKPVAPLKALQEIIDWADKNYENFCCFVLVRENSLDQAISKAVANEVKVWHSDKTKKQGPSVYDSADFTSQKFHRSILDSLEKIIHHKAVLRKLAANNPETVKLITYKTLADDPEEASKSIRDHTIKRGLEPINMSAKRTLKKIINTEQSNQIKQDFKTFLKKHLGPNIIS